MLTGVMASFVQRAPQAADREVLPSPFPLLPPSHTTLLTCPSPPSPLQDLSMLAMLLSSSTYYEVRVNAAAMLGLAGARPDVVEDVAKALSASLTSESHVMVEAEVLNAVMDIFSDDALHPLFTQLGLLKPLKQLLPQVRTPTPPSPSYNQIPLDGRTFFISRYQWVVSCSSVPSARPRRCGMVRRRWPMPARSPSTSSASSSTRRRPSEAPKLSLGQGKALREEAGRLPLWLLEA